MVHERRLHQRLPPSSPQLILLDESKYSLLCDLSEGGLAVEGFAVENPGRAVSLEFDLPESGFCVQAKAELTWTSDSGYRTGFRFLDLAEPARQRLRDWVAATGEAETSAAKSEASTAAFGFTLGEKESHPFMLEDEQAQGPPQQASQQSLQQLSEGAPEVAPPGVPQGTRSWQLQPRLDSHLDTTLEKDHYNSDGGNLHLKFIAVAAVVMSATAFILGYYWRAGRSRPPAQSMAAVTEPFQRSSPGAGPSASEVPPQAAIPPILPLDTPGFVLQVGAMGEEANAEALSNELHKKNFSAFVYHQDRDRFYRVAVGPYTDQTAAVRIKSDLRQEGYKSILRPWSPE
jgi:septal ring-binding cell division protein DamX